MNNSRCQERTVKFPYKKFDFPLNVYALALFLEEGRVDYLHYGLSDVSEEPAWQAQQRSTEMILSRLPPAPCRLLEVGIGLGTTFLKLEKLGYAMTGITPDRHQIDAARHLVGEKARLLNTRFEDLAPDPASYDLILMQESAQYIHPLDLFNRAFDLLTEGGELFILDEVTLKSSETGIENFPLLGHLLAIADRCGFELVEHIDLSSKAAPTLDYLLKVIETHRVRLAAELNLGPDQIRLLMESNRTYRKKYKDGVYGYALLRFRKAKPLRWRVYRSTGGDFQDIANLFKSVFSQEITSELWTWKYGANRGQAVIARRGQEMVAHYGGISRPVMLFGELQPAVQICDVMVRVSERTVFTKQGAFFLAAASASELFRVKHVIGFGFPNRRAMRVAEKLNLYECVGEIVEVRWAPMPDRPQFRSRIRHLDGARDRALVDSLWQAMAMDFSDAIIGVRNSAFVEHRYLAHPVRNYDILVVQARYSSSPLGVIILNRDGKRLEIVDLIGPIKNFPCLIGQARRLARRWKFEELYCWITKNFSPLFVQAKGVEFQTEIQIPTTIWTEGPDPQKIRGHWWLMAGDTDFR